MGQMSLGQSEEIARGASRYLNIAGFTLLLSVVSTNNNRCEVVYENVCIPLFLVSNAAAESKLNPHHAKHILPTLPATPRSRYLVTQQVVTPGVACTAITSLLCPLYNWIGCYW